MFDIISWLPWVGGASTIALIALALLAPSVLQVAAAWLTALSPLLKGIAEGTVSFLKVLWDGLKDMADNLHSIIFVVVIAGLAALWGYHARPEIKNQDCIPLPVQKHRVVVKPTSSIFGTVDKFLKDAFPF
jgi:hypothetical protein